MKLSEEFKKGLNEYFDWEYKNISNQDEPVLIVFNYSPSSESRPFSFAFNLRRKPKCWISHDKVKEIGDKSPNRRQDYGDFNHKGQNFYAYSVQAFENSTFNNIVEFKKVCNRLYANIDEGKDE